MATATASIAPYNGTLATMRAFAQFISDNIQAFGMVKTADTGQTAASALPIGSGSLVVAGYEVFRFNDALQSTAPIYVKIEYGTYTTTIPCIWVTIGTSTDGAGNITGVIGPRTIFSSTAAASATPYASFISGGPNGFRVAFYTGAQNVGYILIFSVERTKDAAGVDTADGCYFQGNSYVGWACMYVPFTGSIRAQQVYPLVPVTFGTLSLADGSNVGMVPIHPMGKRGPGNALSNLLVYYQPDTAAQVPVTVVYNGGSHVYVPLGVSPGATYLTNWVSYGFALLYE